MCVCVSVGVYVSVEVSSEVLPPHSYKYKYLQLHGSCTAGALGQQCKPVGRDLTHCVSHFCLPPQTAAVSQIHVSHPHPLCVNTLSTLTHMHRHPDTLHYRHVSGDHFPSVHRCHICHIKNKICLNSGEKRGIDTSAAIYIYYNHTHRTHTEHTQNTLSITSPAMAHQITAEDAELRAGNLVRSEEMSLVQVRPPEELSVILPT